MDSNVLFLFVVKGFHYSSSVMFPANTSAFSPKTIMSFMIDNNNIGLESDKKYQLMIQSASKSKKCVILGQPTTITVVDDDGELECFFM